MQRSKARQTARILAAAAIAVIGHSAAAATVTWNDATGGDWSDGTNWTGGSGPGGLPNNTDDVNLTINTASYVVNYDQNLYGGAAPNNGIKTLNVTNSTAGRTVTLNVNAPNLIVRGTATVTTRGILNVNDGGAMSVTGGNLSLQNSAIVTVFSGGNISTSANANVILQSGSVLTLLAGGVISQGGGNSNFSVGNESQGTFIMQGGTLRAKGLDTAGRGIAVGTAFGSNNTAPGGAMTVSGGDVINDGRLIIGSYSNTGVSAPAGTAARQVRGWAVMTAGTWSNAGNVVIGFNNAIQASQPALTDAQGALTLSGGTFTVTGGATEKVYVGASSATGTLTVQGTGSLGDGTTSVSEILVGTTFNHAANTTSGVNGNWVNTAGTGTFNVAGGSVFTTQLTAVNGANSKVNFTAGTIHSGGTTFSGVNGAGGAAFAVGDGANTAILNLVAGGTGAHSFAGGINVAAGSQITGAGSITGAAAVAGQVNANGTIAFNDGLTLQSGSTSTFDFTAPGFASGTYDLITSDGGDTVTFGGELVLNFSGGAYGDGSSVQIFNFATYTPGTFANVIYSGLGVGQEAEFDAATGFVTVSAVPEPGVLGLLAVGGLMAMRRRRAK